MTRAAAFRKQTLDPSRWRALTNSDRAGSSPAGGTAVAPSARSTVAAGANVPVYDGRTARSAPAQKAAARHALRSGTRTSYDDQIPRCRHRRSTGHRDRHADRRGALVGGRARAWHAVAADDDSATRRAARSAGCATGDLAQPDRGADP